MLLFTIKFYQFFIIYQDGATSLFKAIKVEYFDKRINKIYIYCNIVMFRYVQGVPINFLTPGRGHGAVQSSPQRAHGGGALPAHAPSQTGPAEERRERFTRR